MTLCGTPEYMAPEVITHSGYDRMVDWWAVGVLAYEFVCGCTPFIDDEDDECGPEIIFANIMMVREHNLELPPNMPHATADFIEGCLVFSPGKRLGIGGASQVGGHYLFDRFDFQALAAQEIVPCYRPRVKTEAELARTLNKRALAPPRDDGASSLDGASDAGNSDWDDVF